MRFRKEYIAYKYLAWWPLMDKIATYGHIVVSGTVVYCAVYLSLSVFMLANLIIVSAYYSIATYRLSSHSEKDIKNSGLLD